jgi:hypothetical protein
LDLIGRVGAALEPGAINDGRLQREASVVAQAVSEDWAVRFAAGTRSPARIGVRGRAADRCAAA